MIITIIVGRFYEYTQICTFNVIPVSTYHAVHHAIPVIRSQTPALIPWPQVLKMAGNI